MRYAAVRNNVVDNVIECDGLAVQKLAPVMNCLLVPATAYPVAAGDTYENGVFYRNGEPLERIPSTDEKVAALENDGQTSKDRLSSIESAILGLMTMLTGGQ